MIPFHSLHVAPKEDYLHSIHFHSFSFLYFKTSNYGYLIPFHSIIFHSFPLNTFHSIPFHSLMIILFHSLPFPSLKPKCLMLMYTWVLLASIPTWASLYLFIGCFSPLMGLELPIMVVLSNSSVNLKLA